MATTSTKKQRPPDPKVNGPGSGLFNVTGEKLRQRLITWNFAAEKFAALMKAAVKRGQGGRPRSKDHAAARAAYRAARRDGIGPDGALLLAQEAGGIRSRSYIYDLRRREDWDRVL